MSKYVGTDTDGTKWVTVRFVTEVQVMAEEADAQAVYLAHLQVEREHGGFAFDRYEFVEVGN